MRRYRAALADGQPFGNELMQLLRLAFFASPVAIAPQKAQNRILFARRRQFPGAPAKCASHGQRRMRDAQISKARSERALVERRGRVGAQLFDGCFHFFRRGAKGRRRVLNKRIEMRNVEGRNVGKIWNHLVSNANFE